MDFLSLSLRRKASISATLVLERMDKVRKTEMMMKTEISSLDFHLE
jgi:hypothetical protein